MMYKVKIEVADSKGVYRTKLERNLSHSSKDALRAWIAQEYRIDLEAKVRKGYKSIPKYRITMKPISEAQAMREIGAPMLFADDPDKEASVDMYKEEAHG